MYKVLITGFGSDLCYQDEEIAAMEGLAEVYVRNGISRAELLDLVKDVDAIMTDTEIIDEEVYEAAKNLKIISEYGVGVDNIDLDGATRHNVYVCNVPHVYTQDVAEHAAALIMAVSRCLFPAAEQVKKKSIWDSAPLQPKSLRRKTLGLIGCGKIGMALLKMLSGLGMDFLVYDPYINKEITDEIGAKLVGLDELLRCSNIISIHVPKTPETNHMISKDLFLKMKPGVILINVSRGGIIDEDALVWALEEGIVFAAGIDVMENEPDIAGSVLKDDPRVLVTPHIAWKSENSARNIELENVKNVISFLRDGRPVNICNKGILKRND